MEKTFTTANFDNEVLQADKPVLVDFYADWCGPCKMMAPVVEQLAGELDGIAYVGKLNVDDNEEIAMKYGVMTIPTLMVFKNGLPAGQADWRTAEGYSSKAGEGGVSLLFRKMEGCSLLECSMDSGLRQGKAFSPEFPAAAQP